MRASGDQQAIVGLAAAVVEHHVALVGMQRNGAPTPLGDAQFLEIARLLAQIGAGFVDVAFKQIRDGHARVGRRIFIAHQDDLAGWICAAQGLGSNDAGGAVAKDHMFHSGDPHNPAEPETKTRSKTGFVVVCYRDRIRTEFSITTTTTNEFVGGAEA